MLALAVLTAAAGAPGLATPDQRTRVVAPQAATCAGVWVVVDYGSLGGGVSNRCATSHSTGVAALRNSGFAPTVEEGFVLKLTGKPASPDIQKAYWSYWQATKQGDGYGAWRYSNLGAGSYKPKPGDAEGWHYVTISGGNRPPGAKPPVAAPEPTPTTTTQKPTPKPSKTSTKPSRTPTSTRSASTAASKTPSRTASPGSATATPSSSTVTPAPSSGQPTSPGAEPPTASQTVVAGQPPGSPPAESASSPIGAIVTGSIVVLAAGGLGAWWWLRGRRT